MPRTINQAGIDLVKHFEGFYPDAYLCPAEVWTIGYGHTANVQQGQTISENEAEELLRADLEDAAETVDELAEVDLDDDQFAALVSFTFNVGRGSLAESTLLKKLNQGDYDAVPSELSRWVKATVDGTKTTLAGLVRRRAAEAELFLRNCEVSNRFTEGDTHRMPQAIEHYEI